MPSTARALEGNSPYRYKLIKSSVRTHPVWPPGKLSLVQPRKFFPATAIEPAESGEVFWVVSTSVGMLRSVPARQTKTAAGSASGP